MKIVGYARLSTKEQSQGQTLEQQIDRLKKAGAIEIYHDLESGRKNQREQFQKLVNDAKEKKISKIICTRVDRFSRDVVTAVSTARELFEKYNVQLLFLDDPELNLKSSDGIFVLNLKAALAQRESDQISERIKHGKNYQRNNGLVVATRAPYGYIINKHRKYELDKRPLLCLLSQRPEEGSLVEGISRSDIARDIVNHYIKLKSAAKAIKEVYVKYGYPSRTFKGVITGPERDSYILNRFGVTNWLANPTLRGHTPHRKEEYRRIKKAEFRNTEYWDIVLDTHPTETLITNEEWELIESLLVINSKRKQVKKNSYNYSGIIFCSCCQNKMTTKSGGKGHRYYSCRTLLCSNQKSIREEKINEFVLKKIFEKVFELKNKSTEVDNFNKSEKLITLEKRLERTLIALEEDPTDHVLIKNKIEYQKQIAEEINKTNGEDIWDKSAEELIRHPSLKDIGFIYTLSNEQRRLVFHKLIKSISVNNDEVTNIEFKFG